MTELPDAETARQNLLYIRKTLEAAGQFTAVPGKSLMTTGLIALMGAAFNRFVTGPPWISGPAQPYALAAWGVVLSLSLVIVSIGILRKSLRLGVPIQMPLIRKLMWSLSPALFIGALLTGLAVQNLHVEWLPVIWIGCYGAAVTNGGQISVAPVRYMGLCFLLIAGIASISPPQLGLVWLAISFGWLHLVYGAYIARRYHG
jgi:hypothetical protein